MSSPPEPETMNLNDISRTLHQGGTKNDHDDITTTHNALCLGSEGPSPSIATILVLRIVVSTRIVKGVISLSQKESLMTQPEWKNSIAITGAGSGFGAALTHLYASRGWNVAVTDIDEERARRTLREIKS